LSLPEAMERALAAYEAGDLDDAQRLCEAILRAKPDDFDAVHIAAIVQSRRAQHDAALAGYDRALGIRPDSAVAHNNRANCLRELGRLDEALASYERAITIRPDYAEAFHNRAVTLQDQRRFADALASYDRAIALRPDYADALYRRGNCLQSLDRYEEALASLDRALAARPDYAEAYNSRGLCLKKLGRADDALASYERALAARPDYPEACYNRGNCLKEMRRFAEAIASYDRAIALAPDYPEAFNNRANCRKELLRFDEALQDYAQAISLRPDYADARFNAALCRLLIGDFARGWEEHETRWEAGARRAFRRNLAQPLWRGEPIAGKTILLYAEQGYGDAIQFCRYVPLVAATGARVLFEVNASLRDLMTSLAGEAQVVPAGAPLPAFDLQCPLLSLPLAFGTRLETIPAATPYLRASPAAMAKWRERLGTKTGPLIGLAWSGSATHHDDANRSIPLRALLPLLDAGATFVSLQKELGADDAPFPRERGDIRHFSGELKTFSDTAALVAQMDLVISVDTSIAHLAGALAKPAWILLPFMPDWRWLLDRDDSPWYPTLRLFRQDAAREWDGVIARVRADLGKLLSAGS
jgi:tetratricopeptide (TPR) repeat protein